MAIVVGLDIGTRTVTGAVFSGTAKKFRLIDFFVEDVQTLESGRQGEDGEFEAPLSIEELIDKILTQRELKQFDIVADVETKDCVVREIPVPFTRDEQIRKTVYFEAEGYFTGFDLDETVLQYIKVSEHDGKSQLVVMALQHSDIERRLGLFKKSGVDPVALELDSAALFNAFAITPTFDPQRTTLLVDMGATSVKLLLIEDGVLKKVRALRLETAVASPDRMIPQTTAVGAGGPEISIEVVGEQPPGFDDYSIEARFQEIEMALRRLDPALNEEGPGHESTGIGRDEPIAILPDDEYDLVRQDDEAEPAEDLPGLTVDDFVASAEKSGEDAPFARRFPGQTTETFDYHRYLERIALEIQRSIAAVRLSSPVELVCLTGGMSGRDEARRYFQEELDVETVQLDFSGSDSGFAADLKPAEQELLGRQGGVAVGLALKQLQHDRIGIDFRQGPYRYEHRFERLRFPLLVASCLFFFFFLQATYWAFHDWKSANTRVQGIRSRSAQIYQAFFEEKVPGGRHPLDAAKATKRKWEGKGSAEVGRFLNAADVVKDFSSVLRESGLKFRIDQLDFKFALSKPMRTSKTKTNEPGLRGSNSKVTLAAKEGTLAFAKLEALFRGPKSSYFLARGNVSGKDEWKKITLDLSLKDDKLRQLEDEFAK